MVIDTLENRRATNRVFVGESLRGNRIGATGLRASERKSASERVSEREGFQRFCRGFERFFRGFQRFLRGFQRSSQRPSQRPSQRQMSSQRLSVLLPLIALPLELSPSLVNRAFSPGRRKLSLSTGCPSGGGVLRDYLLRRRRVLKFLGNKRERQLLRSLFSGSSTRKGGGRKVRALPRILGFRREESGMSREWEFCRHVPDPWECSKSLCKKNACAFFLPYFDENGENDEFGFYPESDKNDQKKRRVSLRQRHGLEEAGFALP